MVLREYVKKVQDLMIEESLEVFSSYSYASSKVSRFLQINKFFNFFHCVLHTRDSSILLKLANEYLWLLDVSSGIIGAIHEILVEEVTAPLDAVLDLTGEVP